jgi:iron(III) transport system permease protein
VRVPPLAPQRVAKSMDLGTILLGAPVLCASLVIIGLLLFVLWMSVAKTEAGLATGGYTMANYVALFRDPLVARAAWNTLVFALLTATVAGAFGLPLAWLAERSDLRGRGAIAIALTIGLLIPGFFTAMGWIFLLHPRIGFVNLWLRQALGLAEAPLPITNIGGMAWIEGLTLAPLFFLMTASSFRAMDPALEEAARVSGASDLQALRRVVLPLMRPGMLAAAIFTFTVALGTFDVPGIVGLASRIFTFSTLIYVKTSAVDDLPNYGLPAAFGSAIVALSLALSVAYVRLLRRSRQYQVVTGKGYRPRLVQLGRWAIAGWGFAGLYIALALILPLMLVLWSSLHPFYTPPSLQALRTVSLATFARVPWPLVLRGLGNSLTVAVLTPTLAFAISIAFSWLILRSRMKGRLLLDEIAFLPQAIPGIIFSLGAIILALFVVPDFLPLYGSLSILVLVYSVSWVSFGTRVVNSAMIQISNELEEAGYAAGATRLGTFRAILLPLVSPALVSAWIWLALLSMRELTRAVILVTGDNITLPVVTWSLWNGNQFAEACAVILTTIALFTPLLLLYFLLARRGDTPFDV